MKRGIGLIAVMMLAAACAAPLTNSNGAQSSGDEAQRIVNEYSGWTPLFESARNISMQLMMLCRIMTETEQAYLQSEHAEHYVQVYANPSGAGVIHQTGQRVFPEGTVIVKEKWDEDPRAAASSTNRKPIGLGIMIKRAAGFAPQARDWEYLYVDAQGIITRDQKQLAHCAACHGENQEADSVFYPSFFSQ